LTAVADPPRTARLLTGLGPGQRADLSAHLSVHGQLAVPARHDDHWSEKFIGLLAESGLTGRGGAGFPTAAKLRWIREQRRRPVLAVNVMEGEPASGKDLVLASHVPHLVLDGAAAVARCVDAQAVFLCVPSDARAVAASFEDALRERGTRGLDPVAVELVRPPGRYIAGEESALSSWLDGGETLPKFRPDRPAVNRVGGRPCLVDNAETLAHVALIARYGAAAFRAEGTDRASGTTLVTVSGAVAHGGVYEVPLGTPLSSVLAMSGIDGRPGALLLGGYGGTWLSADHLDVSFDPASLRAVGATTGAGVIVVLPPGACGLMETARIASWMAGESAGQCGPCVFGLPALAEDLFLLAAGRPRDHDVQRLASRLGAVEGRGACHHPDGVVRLVRGALTVFADDLDHHLAHGPCAGTRQPSVLSFPTPRAYVSPR
jgi:NADH:ubiquinone oxidoreductase subunit F (NADH-binding)